MLRTFPCLVIVLISLLAAALLHADALVVTRAMKASTIAEAFISDGEVRVEIEVGAADLIAFRDVLPDEFYEKLGGEPRPLSDRLRTFTERQWVIQADGKPLSGRVVGVTPRERVVRDEITGEPLPVASEDREKVIFLELAYAFEGQPETLTIQPPLDPSAGLVAASIGFVLYHQGVAVNDFRYFSQQETLQLDWSDPWYSRFERKNLRRRYYAPAAAFIYVENFEVRKEIIFRPKDLQSWVDLGLEGQSVISSEMRDEVREEAAQFLANHTPLQIDGQSVDGTLDRVHFIKRTLQTSGVVEPGENIDINTALIGAIYTYPIESLPQQVAMGWDLFNERITQVPAVTTDEAGGMPTTIDPDDPTLLWQNYLTNPSLPAFMEVLPPPQTRRIPIPVVSVLCLGVLAVVWIRRRRAGLANRKSRRRGTVASIALIALTVLACRWPVWTLSIPDGGSGQLTAENNAAVTHSLLHNVYRAFDYRDEDTIYDVLDRSVSGDLLTKIYLDTQKSLTLASQGGARVKVTDLEMLGCQAKPAEDRGSFLADCTWNVIGSVGHWGHIHQRINQYRAQLTVRSIDGQWKLTDMQLLSEERL